MSLSMKSKRCLILLLFVTAIAWYLFHDFGTPRDAELWQRPIFCGQTEADLDEFILRILRNDLKG